MDNKFKVAFKEALEIDDSKEIRENDSFRDYEEWDSLTQLSLIAMLDDEFSIEIEEDDFEQLKTVKDLAEEVKKRQNA